MSSENPSGFSPFAHSILSILVDKVGKEDKPENYVLLTEVRLAPVLQEQIYVVLSSPKGLEKRMPKGSVLMRDDHRAKEWREYLLRQGEVNPPEVPFMNVYKDGMFSALRGSELIAAKADKDLGFTRKARELADNIFLEILMLDTNDEKAVRALDSLITGYGINFVSSSPKSLKARVQEYFEQLGSMLDVLKRPNNERRPLMVVKLKKLLHELFRLTSGWRKIADERNVAMEEFVAETTAEILSFQRVCIQARRSEPLRRGAVQTGDVAAITWPQWADRLDSLSGIRPLDFWTKKAAHHLRSASQNIDSHVDINPAFEELKCVHHALDMINLQRMASEILERINAVTMEAVPAGVTTRNELHKKTTEMIRITRHTYNLAERLLLSPEQVTRLEEAEGYLGEVLQALSLTDVSLQSEGGREDVKDSIKEGARILAYP
jgi:hypothetical protein